MSYSVQAVIAVFVCSIALALCTPFTDCGSKGGKINSLTVKGCESSPCILKKGTNASFEMDFTATKDFSAATTKITAHLGPIPVPFNPPDTNACHFLTPGCPVKSGAAIAYKQDLPVLSSYPSISVKVEWQLMGADNNAITCFAIDATVQ